MNGRLRLLERPTAELSSIRSDQTKDNVKIYIYFFYFISTEIVSFLTGGENCFINSHLVSCCLNDKKLILRKKDAIFFFENFFQILFFFSYNIIKWFFFFKSKYYDFILFFF